MSSTAKKLELEFLEKIMEGSIPFKAPSHTSGMKLRPPTFDGKNDPKHFFVKLFNYLENYKIEEEEEKIRVLKSCLEGAALDLYLALPQEEQGDIAILENIFQNHFKPKGHDVVETEAFLKLKKGPNQTISEFYTLIRKKAKELLIQEAIVRITFIQGLPAEFQKHCVLQGAITLTEFFEKAKEFEQIAGLGKSPSCTMAMEENPKSEREKMIEEA